MRNWKDYEGIIKGMAYKFAPTLKEHPDDLIQEGYRLFHELTIYEETIGLNCPFEAALSNSIRTTFIFFVDKRKSAKRTGKIIDLFEVENILGFNPEGYWIDYLDLSQEARTLVLLMVNTPQELVDLLKEFDFRKAVTEYLRKYKGWNRGKIYEMWREINSKSVV